MRELLGTMAAWLTAGGIAFGQGYYQHTAPPMYANFDASAVPERPRPIVHGWPPPPGSWTPPPGYRRINPAKLPAPTDIKPAAADDVGRATATSPAPLLSQSPYVPDLPKPALYGWPPPGGMLPAPPGYKLQSMPKVATSSARAAMQEGGVAPAAGPSPQPRALDAGGPASFSQQVSSPYMLYPAPGTALMSDRPAASIGMVSPCGMDGPYCAPCGHRCYGKGEFLFWWLREQESPALFTFQTGQGPAVIDANDIDNEQRIGVRLTLGRWLDPDHCCGIEVGFAYLFEREFGRAITAGSLARPYFDVSTGAAASFPLSALGTNAAAELRGLSRFQTGEVNLRRQLLRIGCGHVDALAGFRYLQLEEGFEVITNVTPVGAAGTVTSDRFGADNLFFGGQVGVEGELNLGRFFAGSYLKVAIGNNHQTVDIAGNRVANAASLPGGFLALPSNIGHYSHDEFAFLPEAGVNAGVRLTDNVRLSGGYSILFLMQAVRPAEQIDRNLNLTQLQPVGGVAAPVGPLAPFFAFQESDFWAQGFNVSLEIRY
ncbi:MAG: BBP7 family outer membrane beta-barrel protein [Gemmataceae bacterium]|nr:BBP7 family outer membrane beta-barrel protein [Gemmataceae bacterium]